MLRKTLLIFIMLLLLLGGATTGIGAPTLVFMGFLTAIAFLVDLSPGGEQQ